MNVICSCFRCIGKQHATYRSGCGSEHIRPWVQFSVMLYRHLAKQVNDHLLFLGCEIEVGNESLLCLLMLLPWLGENSSIAEGV